MLLGISLILFIVLYQHLKKLSLTTFYIFLVLLPFAKGKGIDILILKKEIIKNGLFDIAYLFPIYISSLYLLIFYYDYIRNKLLNLKSKIVKITTKTKIALLFFLLFIIANSINSLFSPFYFMILGASLQLLVLLLIFFIPFVLKVTKKSLQQIYLVIASSTLFQSVWLILQTINQGYLQKDIESHLFRSTFFAIRSSENEELVRLPGTFFESSILGTFLLINLTILIYAVLNNKIKNEKQKIVVLFTIVLTFISSILTGSRGVYLILFSILFLFFYFYKKNYQKTTKLLIKNSKVLYSTLIVFIIFGTYLVAPFFFNRLKSSSKILSTQGSGSYRIELAKYSLRLLNEKPALGVGLDLSPYYLATSFVGEDYFIDPARAHNIFVQLLAESGLIGTALFFIFLYLVLSKVLIKTKNTNKEFHLAAIVFILAAQIYPIFINHMEIISYLFLYLGFAAYFNQENE